MLTATLADVYEDHGDWAFLRGEEDEWRRIVRTSDRSFRQARDAAQANPPRGTAAPGDPAPGNPAQVKAPENPAQAMAPVHARPRAEARADERDAAVPTAVEQVTVGRASGDRGAARTSRNTLLDADRRVIAGDPTPSPDARYGAVQVAGRTVGWVASPPYRELTNAADLSFQ